MLKKAVIGIAATLIVSMATWGFQTARADEADDRAAGAAVAQELCSGCHIVTETQRNPVPDGVPPFSVIASRPGRTIGYLRAYLSDPTPPMPHVPLSKRQIDNVIAYIRSFAD